MNRKKKLISYQIVLLLCSFFVIFFTYINSNNKSSKTQINIDRIEDTAVQENEKNLNIFYDIEYKGLDLSGNRYVLKSKKATIEKEEKERIAAIKKEEERKKAIANARDLDGVERILLLSGETQYLNDRAIYYFKDNSTLSVQSNKGIYNNNTLDMIFEEDVRANYGNSKLFAEKAEYFNTKGFLIISKNVRLEDTKGNMFADKLIFDIKDKQLKIQSDKNKLINANVKLK